LSSEENNRDNIHFVADIHQKHGGFIRSVIVFRVHDRSQVEEIFQDFLLHLLEYPPPRNLESVKNFLFRALVNFIATDQVQRKVNREHLQQYAHEKQPDASDAPEKSVINAEESKKMLALVKERLSPRESTAIIERHVKGLDIDEVARAMGVSSRSVSQYLSDGIKKIQKVCRADKGDKP
jgi:RNA polymerase sigma factor (sigma-70 family)